MAFTDFVYGIVWTAGALTHLVFAGIQLQLIVNHRRLTQDPPPLIPTWGWVAATVLAGPAVTCAFLLLRERPELYSEEFAARAESPIPNPVTGDPTVAPPAPPTPVVPPAPVSPFPPAPPRPKPEPVDPNSPFA